MRRGGHPSPPRPVGKVAAIPKYIHPPVFATGSFVQSPGPAKRDTGQPFASLDQTYEFLALPAVTECRHLVGCAVKEESARSSRVAATTVRARRQQLHDWLTSSGEARSGGLLHALSPKYPSSLMHCRSVWPRLESCERR